MKRLAGTLVCLIAAACAVFPVPPASPETARAWGRLTVSATQGVPGDRVEIDGTGFVAGQTVKAYFSSDAAEVGQEIGVKVTAYEPVGEASIGPTAGFESPLGFNVPSALSGGKTKKTVGSGDYHIYVTYGLSNRIEAAVRFFVLGPVTMTPGEGKIGEWTRISGTGLTRATLAYLYFSSSKAPIGGKIGGEVKAYQNAGIAPVGPDGTLENVSFQVPSRLTDGSIQEDVRGGVYYLYTAYFNARTTISHVTPFVVYGGEITLTPEDGVVGTEVAIRGEGLRPGQEITIEYDGDLAQIKSGSTATDAGGEFACTIAVPESATGSHRITAEDVTGNQPESWFTVLPQVSLASQSAFVNEPVGISGRGFGEAQEIIIAVNGQAVSTTPPIVTTNRRGTFTASFRVAAGPGTARIEVSDTMRTGAAATITVVAAEAAPASIAVTPATSQGTPGHVGMVLAIEGKGFEASTPVTVSLDGENAAVQNTDAEGGFTAGFTVPPLIAGEHAVTVTDGSTSASATFVMESRVPPPPVPVLPEVGAGVKPAPRFDWGDVSDESGVTYTFQISTDSAFGTALLERGGLSRSEYALSSGEQLELRNRTSSYFWRVKAVDGAGNESAWTIPVLFYVGSATLPMPAWSIYTLAGLGAVLILAVVLWMRLRARARPRI